jgi:hypothetical protein
MNFEEFCVKNYQSEKELREIALMVTYLLDKKYTIYLDDNIFTVLDKYNPRKYKGKDLYKTLTMVIESEIIE